ncbi:MAG: 30S ribosome-binding factor RbfA [Bacteroidota bacterium]
MKESNRQKKFGKLIQKELSVILQRDITLENAPMLTVTVVRGTPDLRIARVYISVFPQDQAEAAMEGLQEANKEIRHLLAQKIRRQVRNIPEIQFYLDDTAQEVKRMDALFDSLNEEND